MYFRFGQDGTKCKSGFTLVELLVVISIIALLLATLMPSLRAAREQAKRVVCASNIKQMYYSMLFYVDDNKRMMPPNGTRLVDPQEKCWAYLFQKYWGSDKNTANNQYIKSGIPNCKSEKLQAHWSTNTWLSVDYALNNNLLDKNTGKPINFDKIKKPQQKILFVDSYKTLHWTSMYTSGIEYRHSKQSANYVFCDGNIQNYKEGVISPLGKYYWGVHCPDDRPFRRYYLWDY